MWCSVLKWAVCLFRAPYASSLGCKHRPGAVSVVLGSYESSWAVSVVLGSYESSWGRKRRPGAVRVVFAQYLSSLGRTCRPGAVRMVLEPCVSSWRRTHGPWAVRIILVLYVSSWAVRVVVGLYASLLGCTRCCCWAARFRRSRGVGERSSRWGCPTRRWSPLLYCRGSPGRRGYAGSVRPPAIWRRVEGDQWGENEGGKGENEPRQMSWLVSRRTCWASHIMGPPLVLLPTVLPEVELENQPTSLKRGEGHMVGWKFVVEGWWRDEVMVVVVDERRMDPRSTVMRLISDSNSAPTLNRPRRSQHLRVRLEK